jgi:hypothetical protein
MNDSTFDPKSIFETYRNAFAPTLKAQQEGVKAIDRVGRYQYAVAGDYLEWSLAQAKAALARRRRPTSYPSKWNSPRRSARSCARARRSLSRWRPTPRPASPMW